MSGSEGPAENPYVGLRPFYQEDSMFFFGRDQQTAELLETLHQQRFLSVVGSSGCGKSSLVRAGMVPLLLAGFLVQDRDRWAIARMKPGGAPLANLAKALADLDGSPDAESAAALEEKIREGHTDAVVEFLRGVLGDSANFLLLVDQFEEIFAFRAGRSGRQSAEAADFVDLLIKLSERRELPIYVTLTMRTDFLGDCDLFYGLPEAMNRGRYLVPRLTRQQLRDAIQGPVLLMRARMAPRLLDRLLNQLGDRSDRLPVLQHALLRTWDAWAEEGGVGPIDLNHYKASGGLDGALAKDAERALSTVDAQVTARIFKRLTDTDISQRRVRRPARISELAAVSEASREDVERIIARFREDRRNFLYPSDDGVPEDPRIDLAHESLIRQWGRLRDWVDEERVSRDQFADLVERGRGGLALLKDPDLQMARTWRGRSRPTREWAKIYSARPDDFEVAMDYLDRSVEEADADARREQELLEREKRLALEEKEHLEAENRRRKRQSRIGMAVAAAFAAIAIFAGVAMQRAIAAEAEIRLAAGLLGATEAVVQGSAEMSRQWGDPEVSNEDFVAAYESVMRPLELPPTVRNTWDPRIEALQEWKRFFEDADAMEQEPSRGINEKVDAWSSVEAESPRIGPHIAIARARIDDLQAILEGSFEAVDGSLVVCTRPPPGCPPQASECLAGLIQGQPACVYFTINTFDQTGARQVSVGYSWLSASGDVLDTRPPFTEVRGSSFNLQRFTPAAFRVPAGPSAIQIANSDGVVVFRQEVVPGA